MALTKETITDKIESVRIQDYYILQVREAVKVYENGELLSEKLHRSTLTPDADTSAISDPVVLAQFNAVMTDEIKANYAKFVKEQAERDKAS